MGARTTLRYHHADGSWRWFEAQGTVVTQNGIHYILGVSRDVTQRKQTEEALHAAEAKYRALVEQIPAIIYTAEINEQSSTLYVSPQIESILGFTPEEWMADPDLWLKQLYPDDRQRVLDKERAVVAGFARAVVALRPELKKAALAKPLTMLLFGMINWMFTWMRDDGMLDHAGMAPVVADLFLGGLPAVKKPVRVRTPAPVN
jgi:hypothetical protein